MAQLNLFFFWSCMKNTNRSSNSLQHPWASSKGGKWVTTICQSLSNIMSKPNKTLLTTTKRVRGTVDGWNPASTTQDVYIYINPANIGRSFTIGCAGFLKHQQYFQKAFAFSLSRPADARFDDWSCSSVWDQVIQKQQKHGESQLVIKQLPSSKLTWQWKITIFNRKYIFNPGPFSIA